MNVRFCLPVTTCWASAWMISGLPRNLWKFCSTNAAELSSAARALIERMAASGSLPPASAGCSAPGICNPLSMFQVARRQSWSRQSPAISRKASSCSQLSIQIAVKAAETYSVSWLDRFMELLPVCSSNG